MTSPTNPEQWLDDSEWEDSDPKAEFIQRASPKHHWTTPDAEGTCFHLLAGLASERESPNSTPGAFFSTTYIADPNPSTAAPPCSAPTSCPAPSPPSNPSPTTSPATPSNQASSTPSNNSSSPPNSVYTRPSATRESGVPTIQTLGSYPLNVSMCPSARLREENGAAYDDGDSA